MEWPSTVTNDTKPVEVFALPTGQLSHPDRWLFEDGDEDLMTARHVYPNFSFLIRHHSGKSILFDLGLTKVCGYQTFQQLINLSYRGQSFTEHLHDFKVA